MAAGSGTRELLILGMLGDDPVKCAHVLQRSSHQTGVRDAATIVGKHSHSSTGPSHKPELGQLNSVQTLAYRADWHYLGMTVTCAKRCNMLGGFRGVRHWSGIGNRQYRGESAAGSSQRAGLDRLGVLASWLTKVRVQVDQARQ